MKKAFIAALALVAMAGCNKTLIETPNLEGDYGYLTLGISSNPDMVITKADDTQTGTDVTYLYYFTLLYSATQNGTYTPVTGYTSVKIGNGESDIKDADSDTDGIQIKLQAGWYKLQAMSAQETYTDNDKGAKYLYGESGSAQLMAGGSIGLTANCSVYNTAVSVKPTAKFTSTFINENVTVSTTWGNNTSRSYTFINEVNDNTASATEVTENTAAVAFTDSDMVFFPAYSGGSNSGGYYADLAITVNARTSASQNTFLTYKLSKKSYRAKWTQITLDAGVNGTISITITTTDDLDTGNPNTETIILDPSSANTTVDNSNPSTGN